MTTKVYMSGTCRVCGCTDLSPCIIPGDQLGLDPSIRSRCAWLDGPRRTLCSNLRCIAVTPLDELIETFFTRQAAASAAGAR